MLIVLALVLLVEYSLGADGPCVLAGQTCKCVAQANVNTCTDASSVAGLVVDKGSGVFACRQGNEDFCDNNGLVIPSGQFCCHKDPPSPPSCSPALTSFSYVLGALKCKGSQQGTIVITGLSAGSSGPVTVKVNGNNAVTNVVVGAPGTGTPVSGIFDGVNTVTVTNSAGCSFTDSNVVNSGPIAVQLVAPTGPILVSSPFCNGGLGRIRLNPATGGTPPYQYQRDGAGGGVFQSDIVFNALTAATGGGTTYSFFAKDVDGCISNTVQATVTMPATPVSFTATQQPPTCGPTSGTGANLNGTIDVTAVAGGSAPYQVSLDDGGFVPIATLSATPGTHSVTVRDALGCALTKTVVVLPTTDILSTSFTAVFASAFNPVLPCEGSVVQLTVTGADSYQIDGQPATSGVALPVRGSTHTVQVTRAAVCSKSFTVSTPVGNGGPCDDGIATTSGDTCREAACTGGCITLANQKSCPTGTIGIQLETSLLLCATSTPQLAGLKALLADWKFCTGSTAASCVGVMDSRISLTQLNNMFVGSFTKKSQGGITTFTMPNGVAITFDVTGCSVKFDVQDRKRIVAPFDVITLGGKPSL